MPDCAETPIEHRKQEGNAVSEGDTSNVRKRSEPGPSNTSEKCGVNTKGARSRFMPGKHTSMADISEAVQADIDHASKQQSWGHELP